MMKSRRQTPPIGIGKISDADRQERKIGDGIVPGHLHKPAAPDDHEDRDQRHQQLDEEVEQPAVNAGQLVGEEGDIHVQVEPVAGGRADKGHDDCQENRERFGPGCGAVEYIAR